MQAYLMQKRVWGIIDGSDPKPNVGDAGYRDWNKDVQLAAGAIYLGLEENQKSQIRTIMGDPVKMWEELKAIHVQKRPSTRFNAYNTLLSILKLPEESLPSLTARIEKAMQDAKNLRPDAFTLDDLDGELMSMVMIRSLPPDFSSFVSSLILLPQLDFKTLKEAFLLEEDHRKAADRSTAIAAAANLTKTTSKRPNPSSTSPAASPSSTKPTCEFCQTYNHTQAQCRLYKAFQQQAVAQASENRKNRRKGVPYTSSNKAVASTSSEQAGNTQDGGVVEEFAGNASIALTAASKPKYSLSLCWCADTGASSHMTPHRAWFDEYEPYSIPVRVADGTVVNSTGIGSIRFQPVLQGVQSREVVFHRVLHVPQLQNNLLSVLYLTSQQRFEVTIVDRTMSFFRDETLLFTATQQHQLAYLDGTTLLPHSALSTSTPSLLPLTLDLWHRRLLHRNLSDIKHLLTSILD